MESARSRGKYSKEKRGRVNIGANSDACLSPRLLIKRPIKGRPVINRSLIDVRTEKGRGDDTAFYHLRTHQPGDTCVSIPCDLAILFLFFFLFRPLPRSIERNRCTIARRLDRLNYDARYTSGRKRLIGSIVTSCGDVNSWKSGGVRVGGRRELPHRRLNLPLL